MPVVTFESHPDCRECKLCEHARSVGVPTVEYIRGVQGGDALVVLGQQPGQVEDDTGLPFVGPSGEMLKRDYLGPILKRLPDLTVYLTNTARCFAPDLPDSALKCFSLYTVPDLWKIVEAHPRSVLLCTGAPAVKAVGRYLLERKLTLKQAMREQPIKIAYRSEDSCWLGGDHELTMFATYHPAALLRGDRAKAGPVSDHMELLYRFLINDMPVKVEPRIVKPRPPSATDTRMISLDIESYGAVVSFPEQTTFIAPLAPHLDKVTVTDLVQTVAITLIENESCQTTPTSTPSTSANTCLETSLAIPSSSQTGITNTEKCATKPSRQLTHTLPKAEGSESQRTPVWPLPPEFSASVGGSTTSFSCGMSRISLERIATAAPGETMIFQMNRKDHQRCLWKWLIHSQTILGMNLLFDLTWMRTVPVLRRLLSGRHTLIDVSVLNSLESEQRPERGLKDLGRVLLTYEHRDPLGSGQRFYSQSDPLLLHYNATDSTVTVLAARELARRILTRSTP